VNQSNASEISCSEPTCQVIWFTVPCGLLAQAFTVAYAPRGKKTNE